MMNVELNKQNIAQVPALRVKCYLATGPHEVSFQCTTEGTKPLEMLYIHC